MLPPNSKPDVAADPQTKGLVSDDPTTRLGAIGGAAGVPVGDRRPLTDPIPFDPHAPGPGMILGQYRILEQLGAGGMGVVWKALHLQLEKPVALKLLPAHLVRDPEVVARFHREIRAIGRLEHPNLVRAFDAGTHSGTHYLVMECIDGIDLSKYVRQCGALPVAEALQIFTQAVEGLAEAHAVGLVHRDIKPGNLMLTRKGTIKVMDLGLARLHQDTAAIEEGALTAAGQILGTPDYMAPEQWDDTHKVDTRCDLYSLGCTLFYLITGQPPYSDCTSTAQKMKAHLTHPIPDLREARRAALSRSASSDGDESPTLREGSESVLPEGLVALCRRLLSKAPEDRYASAQELLQALAALTPADGSPAVGGSATWPELTIVSESAATLRRRGSKGVSRHRNSWIGTAAALIGSSLLLAGIWLVVRKPEGATVKNPVAKGSKVKAVDTEEGAAPVVPPWGVIREPDFAQERSSAEWLLRSSGCESPVLFLASGDGGEIEVTKADSLPTRDFTISLVHQPGNRHLTDAELEQWVAPLSRISNLNLNYCESLTQAAFASLDQLNRLRLLQVMHTGITPQSLVKLISQRELTLLAIDSRQCTPQVVQAIVDAPQLRSIHLVEGSDDQVRDILKVPALIELALLANAGVQHQTLRTISTTQPNLQTLNLVYCKPSAEVLESLAPLRELANISLKGSQVDDVALNALAKVSSLRRLELIETKVTAGGVARLHESLPECEITWDGGRVGPIASHRAIAEAAIAAGGSVGIRSSVVQQDAAKLADLPSTPFLLEAIGVAGKAAWTDREMSLLRGLPALHFGGFAGTSITDAELAPLQALSLVGVDLGYTNITDLGARTVVGNPMLIQLNLGFVPLTPETWQRLAALPRLRGLNSVGGASGIATLVQCRSLNQLGIGDGVRGADLTALRDLPHLRNLRISQAGADYELLSAVEQIRSLRAFSSDGDFPAAAALRLQAARPELVVLHAAVPSTPAEREAVRWIFDAGGKFTNGRFQDSDGVTQIPERSFRASSLIFPGDRALIDGAEKLTGLRYLDVVSLPQLSRADDVAEHLTAIPTLRHVAIDGNTLSAVGLARLATLPELENLEFHGSPPRLADADWQSLTKCRWLNRLVLDLSEIGDEGVQHLGQLSELDFLHLNKCRNLTAAGLNHLRSLRWLRVLFLHGANLDDTAIEPLSQISSLRQLHLTETHLTTAGLERLHAALPHCAIFHDGGLIMPLPIAPK